MMSWDPEGATLMQANIPRSSVIATANPLRHGLLTTKLYPPRLRPDLVARPRLVDAILADDHRFTIISAPAGYGKSVLVAQWMMKAGIPAAWISLDSGDDDPWSFFSLVIGGLVSVDPEVALRTQSVLDDPAPPVMAVVRSLLDDLSATTRPFALILDDYQAIEAPEIHHAVGTLLQNLPPAMRVVVVTRTDLPLPVARLRSQGDLLEFNQEDLRFTDDEALELLQRTKGLEVTPGDVAHINARAEGWAMGLQLVGQVMRDQPHERIRRFAKEFSGNVRPIETYLWEEVIQRQPDEIREFLLRTSILAQLTPPLCDAVIGSDRSAALIQRLEQESLFIVPLDHFGHWYRYHHLFADVLRDRLARQVSEVELVDLHRRAAVWFEQHDFIEESAQHAEAGRDWGQATRLLEQIGADLYEKDRMQSLRTWLQGLPSETLERSPRLAFWLAYALTRTGYFQQAVQPLRIAEQAWSGSDRMNTASLRMLQAFRATTVQDTARALEYAQQALDLLPEDQPNELALAFLTQGVVYFTRGDTANAERALASARVKADAGRRSWIQLAEMGTSAGVMVQQGKLLEATVLLRRMIKLADEQHAIQSQHALYRLGNIYVEWDMLDEAERLLRHADALCEQTRTMIWRSAICTELARVAWAWGEFEAAIDEIERAIDYANQIGWLSEVRYNRAQQARFWLASNQVALARRWAESAELDPYLPPEFERQFELLTFVRLLIAEDRPSIALQLLNGIGEQAVAMGRSGDMVEIMMLRALAHKRHGDSAGALEALDQALALGEPGGYIRVFASEGEFIAPLLRYAQTRGTRREYAQRLLATIEGASAPPLPVQTDSTDALSDREIEVLRLVEAGLSNRDIGHRLFISEKTVKKHLSNILGKLQSANRTQAVDQARRLGLL
jgi:LuxR family maltose regulon positive regulatory protein